MPAEGWSSSLEDPFLASDVQGGPCLESEVSAVTHAALLKSSGRGTNRSPALYSCAGCAQYPPSCRDRDVGLRRQAQSTTRNRCGPTEAVGPGRRSDLRSSAARGDGLAGARHRGGELTTRERKRCSRCQRAVGKNTT